MDRAGAVWAGDGAAVAAAARLLRTERVAAGMGNSAVRGAVLRAGAGVVLHGGAYAPVAASSAGGGRGEGGDRAAAGSLHAGGGGVDGLQHAGGDLGDGEDRAASHGKLRLWRRAQSGLLYDGIFVGCGLPDAAGGSAVEDGAAGLRRSTAVWRGCGAVRPGVAGGLRVGGCVRGVAAAG